MKIGVEGCVCCISDQTTNIRNRNARHDWKFIYTHHLLIVFCNTTDTFFYFFCNFWFFTVHIHSITLLVWLLLPSSILLPAANTAGVRKLRSYTSIYILSENKSVQMWDMGIHNTNTVVHKEIKETRLQETVTMK